MITPWRLVGYTGHRQLADEPRVQQALASTFERLASDGAPLALVGSAAAGADTLCLEAAQARGLPAFVILPFHRHLFSEGFTPDEWRRAETLIEGAVHVEVARGDDREDGFLEAGTLTVDLADVVIAVWDGGPPKGPGGTGAIVAYARALHKPLLVIDPTTGRVSDESVRLGTPAPAAPAWRTRRLRAEVETQFVETDARARESRPAAQWLVFWVITLHLVATAVAVAGVTLHLAEWAITAATAVKVGLLVAALALAWRHRQTHHRWMHDRMTAELCRSYLALWPLRRREPALPHAPIPGFDALRRTLETSWRADTAAAMSLADARQAYWLRLQEQELYFDRSHRESAIRYRRWRGIAVGATLASIACGLGALALTKAGSRGDLYSVVKFLSIVLPLVNAATLSAILALDLGRRVERYRQMCADLAAISTRLRQAQTWAGLWRVARDGEELLLYEVAEWLTVTKFAGDSH